jgi:hypothetical protein
MRSCAKEPLINETQESAKEVPSDEELVRSRYQKNICRYGLRISNGSLDATSRVGPKADKKRSARN